MSPSSSRRPIFRLVALLKPHWRQYSFICALGLVLAALDMVPPKLIGMAVNTMTQDTFSMLTILKLCGIWGFVVLMNQGLHGLQLYLAQKRGESVLAEFREKLFNHLQDQPLPYFQQTPIGRLLSAFGADLHAIRNLSVWGFNTITSNASFMIFSAVALFLTSPILFLSVCWIAPAVTLLNYFYGKKISEAWREARDHAARVSGRQAENISGVSLVSSFNRQEHNLREYEELQKQDIKNHVVASRRSGIYQPFLQGLRFSGTAILLLFGGYRVVQGDMTPGALVAATLYWDWFMMPAMNFGSFFNEVMAGSTAAERVFSILDTNKESKPDVIEKTLLTPLKGRIRFDRVGFSYVPDKVVLPHLNFDIAAGSTVALVGETGSGKSTILSLLSKFYSPQNGQIFIDEHPLHEISDKDLRRNLALVLQSNYLFDGTILENITYGSPNTPAQTVIAAAQKLGLHDKVSALSMGYDTQVGEKGGCLSLGERQLICFTRALIRDPKILLLDEATSALDPESDYYIQKALRKLCAGRTTIIVTHRLNISLLADEVLLLKNGQLIERGSHQDLLSLGGEYTKLFTSGSWTTNDEARSLAGSASL